MLLVLLVLRLTGCLARGGAGWVEACCMWVWLTVRDTPTTLEEPHTRFMVACSREMLASCYATRTR